MIKLDLMELSDCFTPQQLVAEIFRQCPDIDLPIPIKEIAKAVGIEEIQAMQTEDVEGMLVADDGKNHGVIFYKASSPHGRQRFTIGHELGHFLLLHHGAEQSCAPKDIKFTSKSDNTQQLENEANEFSQSLLMPDDRISLEINSMYPTMEGLKKIEQKFEMSFEAISNKCATHSTNPFALIYSKDGIVRYSWRDWKKFPHWIPFKSGDSLPNNCQALLHTQDETISESIEVDALTWIESKFNKPYPRTIIEQTYTQLDGYQVTMLRLES